MSDEAKFTQADLDALKAEHEKAINDLKDRHKEELDRKVDGAVKKALAEAEEKAKEEYEKILNDRKDDNTEEHVLIEISSLFFEKGKYTFEIY